MSLFRQKKVPKEADPTSREAWEAIRKGSLAVQARLLQGDSTQEATEAAEAMRKTLRLTPASDSDASRTLIPGEWSYRDYQRVIDAVKATCGALIASGAEDAETMVTRMNETIEAYTKCVKRERSMERLSGETSNKRGLL
jgi:hypothetical protein